MNIHERAERIAANETRTLGVIAADAPLCEPPPVVLAPGAELVDVGEPEPAEPEPIEPPAEAVAPAGKVEATGLVVLDVKARMAPSSK